MKSGILNIPWRLLSCLSSVYIFKYTCKTCIRHHTSIQPMPISQYTRTWVGKSELTWQLAQRSGWRTDAEDHITAKGLDSIIIVTVYPSPGV